MVRADESPVSKELLVLAGGLGEAVASVFQTMMQLEVAPGGAELPTAPDGVVALVHFRGNWCGALQLEVSPCTACVLAARFLSMEVPDGVDGDVLDVLGELTNIIGGAVKSALDPGMSLSIPEVSMGSEFEPANGAGTVGERQDFVCEAGVFRVSLIPLERMNKSEER